MPYDDVIANTVRSSEDRRPGRRVLAAERLGSLAAAFALAAAPAAFAADPPHGSHGEETDAPAVTTAATYSRAVGQICADAVRWLALERRLADAYALNYVRIYDLVASPRSPRGHTRAARGLASVMRHPIGSALPPHASRSNWACRTASDAD